MLVQVEGYYINPANVGWIQPYGYNRCTVMIHGEKLTVGKSARAVAQLLEDSPYAHQLDQADANYRYASSPLET